MLTNQELSDAIHQAREDVAGVSSFDVQAKTTICLHLESLQAIQRDRAKGATSEADDDEYFESIGFITNEGLERLTVVGNDSRGAVSIHANPTRAATVEVFVRSEP